MIHSVNHTGLDALTRAANASGSATSGVASTDKTNGPSFADLLKNSIGEVSRLQEDASKAVQDLATGKNENVTGVMTAVEKSDLAFKTLLSIRSKLMDAYEEIKNIPI